MIAEIMAYGESRSRDGAEPSPLPLLWFVKYRRGGMGGGRSFDFLSAHHLLDEMQKKAAGTGEDPFRVLPDDLLDHIMSFLPGNEALQTCVLDTQWRDFWRRKTSLRFILEDWSSFSRERFSQLVKLIIQLRGEASLIDCQIDPCSGEYYINFTEAEPLIEYVLKCRVEKLSICASGIWYEAILLDERFISRHLRTIEFGGVDLLGYSLDFSVCPALEELKIEGCLVDPWVICSESLKHLWIGHCAFSEDYHSHIAAPRLISLELGSFLCLTPSLETMPLLEKASILLGHHCYNVCQSVKEDFSNLECECLSKCLLLNGLSNAVELKLIAVPKLLIFKQDLEWCPKFDRLKTLTLNEWFTAIDLFCILKNSPILEKLILQLGNTKNFVGAMGSKQSFACASILAVNIQCRKVDEGVHKILEVLSTCGILREQISLKCRGRT